MNNVIRDIELELKTSLYTDKERLLAEAQKALVNITIMAETYMNDSHRHQAALKTILNMGNEALGKIT